MSSLYPYADRFPVNRGLPEQGRPRDEVIAELRALASEEDASWEDGRCSGSMYCGDHDHYAFMNEAFALFSHMNVLQRDMCPSATRFEGEIIAMALDLMHGDAAVERGHDTAGMVTSGGSGSIGALRTSMPNRWHPLSKAGWPVSGLTKLGRVVPRVRAAWSR